MAYSTHRTNTRPPTTIHRVEPLIPRYHHTFRAISVPDGNRQRDRMSAVSRWVATTVGAASRQATVDSSSPHIGLTPAVPDQSVYLRPNAGLLPTLVLRPSRVVPPPWVHQVVDRVSRYRPPPTPNTSKANKAMGFSPSWHGGLRHSDSMSRPARPGASASPALCSSATGARRECHTRSMLHMTNSASCSKSR